LVRREVTGAVVGVHRHQYIACQQRALSGAKMALMNRANLGREIYRRSHLTGEFRLRSGTIANEYFDKYLFESDPELLRHIAEALESLVPAGTDGLAGLELGGVPLAVMLSQITGLPAFFVRKQAKAYGTRTLAEGGDVDGRRLVVVEDVVTTGGAVLTSCHALAERGAKVSDVVCVIDREAGGPEHLQTSGLVLHALFRMRELSDLAQV